MKGCATQSAIVLVIGLLAASGNLLAQDGNPDPTNNRLETLDAHQAVRRGNERLIAGEPDEALKSYQQAKTLEPDAREISFVQGLAHFDLAQFEPARDAFRRAAGVENDGLAADALYSLGATDHAEAISTIKSNPKQSLSLLESGMRRYHDVLADRPDHEIARTANRRAASLWRELKQQLEEQEQQQDQNQDGEDEEQQDQQGENKQEQDDNENQQQDEQESQEQSESADESKDQQEQESQAQKQEQVSREQAERRLREMMQAIRDRKKQRKEQTRKVQIAPVEKDW